MVVFLNELVLFGFREVLVLRPHVSSGMSLSTSKGLGSVCQPLQSLGGADEEFRALQQKWHTEWGDCRWGVVAPLILRNKKRQRC